MRWLWLGIAVVVGGCTAPNPKSCADGTCGDPALPFCDVNGTLGGLPNECIAPACESNTFAECRGDSEVRCNATGDGYDVTRCERGCEPGIGCLACDPNETVCANGSVVTCNAAGDVTVVEDCPLGCYESEPRCREVDPSNGLGMYLDMVPSPPDLDLGGGGTIDTTEGTISTAGDVSLDVPTFLVPAPAGGAPIRVFVANDVVLGDVSVTSGGPYGGPALAIVARGEIDVVGSVGVQSGDLLSSGCSGSNGVHEESETTRLASGSGGGAHATDGAAGGATSPGETPGGQGGRAQGTAELVPLRGGCAAGGTSSTIAPATHGVRGGGAVQMTSRRLVRVAGHIDVRGTHGDTTNGYAFSGGGAGGGILLEAPRVELEGRGGLVASGGDGGGCTSSDLGCGARGSGAQAGSMAQPGGEPTGTSRYRRGGGGGGGLGRIRINSKDASYTASSTFELNGDRTPGTLATR